MKKHIMALSALALSVMGGLNMAHAQDGTVTFNGSIVSDTCILSTDSKDITVDLGQMSQGTTSGATNKKFTLDLTACPAAASKATVLLNAGAHDGYVTSIIDYIDGVESAGVTGDNTWWNIENGETGTFMLIDGTSTANSEFTLMAGDNKLPLEAVLNGAGSNPVKIGSHTGEATYTISYQ